MESSSPLPARSAPSAVEDAPSWVGAVPSASRVRAPTSLAQSWKEAASRLKSGVSRPASEPPGVASRNRGLEATEIGVAKPAALAPFGPWPTANAPSVGLSPSGAGSATRGHLGVVSPPSERARASSPPALAGASGTGAPTAVARAAPFLSLLGPSGPRASSGGKGAVGELARGEAAGSRSSLAPNRGTSGTAPPGASVRAASASAARPRASRRGTP
eukprot:7829624-Alexandrium_andersonii.AAC.2